MDESGCGVGRDMRLFAGFFLPEHINSHLQMALESVSDPASDDRGGGARPSLRWVSPEDRHLTLGFFGEVPGGAVEDLIPQLESVAAAAPDLPLRLRGAGVFTGRTLWSGVQERSLSQHSNGSSPLIDLMRAVEQTGAGFGPSAGHVQARGRRRAHVTLARARDRRRGEVQIRRRADALAVYEGPEWIPDRVHLVRSELGSGKSGAPQYSTIAELPLGSRD